MTYNIFYLLNWLAYFGSSKEYNGYYDVNGDGQIGLSDLLELLTLFGTTI
jgi:hypothetical protein